MTSQENSNIVPVENCVKPVMMDSMEEDDEPLVFKRSRSSATSDLENANQPMKVEKPWTRPVVEVDDSAYLDNDDEAFNEDDIGAEDNKSDEEDDFSEHVCEICDDGGTILCCQGKCLRSFHPTVEDGIGSNCKSLGFTEAEMEEMDMIDFYCENCKYKQHQCFICGELGSSDESSGAEVFNCINGACGRFYHPICVAKLIHPGDEIEAQRLAKKVIAGEQFTCPLHKCRVCRGLEDKSDHELQFAVCRRCPRAYHRKCLPRIISSERAWENLIPNRILIYCLGHKLNPRIGTPVKNHIKFPGYADKTRQPLGSSGNKSDTKPSKRREDGAFGGKQGNIFKTSRGVDLSRRVSFGKHKILETQISKRSSRKSNEYFKSEPRTSLVRKLHIKDHGKLSQPAKPRGEDSIDGKLKQTGIFELDVQSKMRILAMTREVSSSITLETIFEEHKTPSTHSRSLKYVVDKVITSGKVEGSIKAVHTALKILKVGGSVEDAKAVCGADLLIQILKWKKMLKVHLAPFLHGMRYTSFGRHFTSNDKLEEIVNMLHWYVEGGDTIVDFCCGSNDFSCLMKKKLDETEKSCFYKNYDIVQAKNDFNFEKRDWMGVRPDELPKGSQLIMGLNPPFGVDASLANKFINKALEFKPKLLILIVPRETLRLDKKKTPYDLIWENDRMLIGKSFYLPGSVDVNNKQLEDWNIRPPPLYLWSRPDWTAKHKDIAQQHGHLSMAGGGLWPEENQCRMDGPHDCGGTEGNKNDDPEKNHSEVESKCNGKTKWESGPNETSPKDEAKRFISSHCSPNTACSRSSGQLFSDTSDSCHSPSKSLDFASGEYHPPPNSSVGWFSE